MTCRAAALDQVVNVGPREGLTRWRSLCRLFVPRVEDRFAGVLLSPLNFDFSGDVLAAERELARYEQAPQEQVSGETTLKQHILLNSERRMQWAYFHAEVINVRRAQTFGNGNPQPLGHWCIRGHRQRVEGKGQGKRCCVLQ